MPRVHQMQTNWVAGEIDPTLLGRPDLKHYYNGAWRARNVIVLPQGGAQMRPGSRWLFTVPDGPGGGPSNVRLASFQFNTEQTYLFVFSHLKLTIFRNNSQVAQLTTEWESDDLLASETDEGDLITSGISWTQSKDTMLVFHENFPVKQIKRMGSHTSWAISDFTFKNVPRFDFGETTYNDALAGSGYATDFTVTVGSIGNVSDGNPATTATFGSMGNLTSAALSARRAVYFDLGAQTDIGAVTLAALAVGTPPANSYLQIYTSTDGTTYSPYGDVIFNSATSQTITRSEIRTTRYVALVASQHDYTLSAVVLGEITAYAYTVGVDEVQIMTFPSPGGTGNWSEGDTFTLTLEDQTTSAITFRLAAGVLAGNIQNALRALGNTAAQGITVAALGTTPISGFRVTFTGDDGSRAWGSLAYEIQRSFLSPSMVIEVMTRGQKPGEYVWSEDRGYPRCGCFFQGRLWMASTPNLPHYLWGSRSGAEDDFNAALTADDYGIAVPADTEDVPAFTALYAGRHLQAFATSGEFYVPASDADKVTPNNIALRRTSSRGCKPGLRVYEVDGATHFVQRRGRALREFIFADVEAAYQANNLALLSPHLMRDPVDFGLRRATSTTDADFEYLPNGDGTMTVFCVLRTQEVNAFTLWQTAGSYTAVCSVLDEVYFAVQRTVGEDEKVFIEIQDGDIEVDCAVTGGASAGAALPHLPGLTIEHVVDGVLQVPIDADGSGDITFETAATASYSAGLKMAAPDSDYPDMIWLVKSLPVAVDLPEGAHLGRKCRVVTAALRLYQARQLLVNGLRLTFRNFGDELLDQAIAPFTGVKRIKGMRGWDYDGSVVIGSDVSLRSTLLATNYGVSI